LPNKKTPHRESFGQGEIKMCILGILFKQNEEISFNKILRLLPRTQSPDRLKRFLLDLEEKGKINILSRDNIRLGQKTYIITQSGKSTVLNYLDARYKNIIDVFEPTKPIVIEDVKRFWGWVTGIYPTHRTE